MLNPVQVVKEPIIAYLSCTFDLDMATLVCYEFVIYSCFVNMHVLTYLFHDHATFQSFHMTNTFVVMQNF